MRAITPLIAAISLVSLCGLASAQAAGDAPPPPLSTIRLTSGEELRATVLERTDKAVVIQHPLLGKITIPNDKVSFILAPGAPAPAPAEAPVPAEKKTEEEKAVEAPKKAEEPPKPKDKWSGGLLFALNGSEGNNEYLNVLLGFNAKHEQENEVLELLATYQLNTSSGDRTANRFFAQGRNEWLFKPGPWGYFLQGSFEYNEFTDYNTRFEGLTGPSYRFIDNDTTFLIVRGGVGAAQEFGGDNTGLQPVASIGGEFTHKFDDRQSIRIYGDWTPQLDQFAEWRSTVGAAYEIKLTETSPWRLRLGVEDRYQNRSGDSKHNDLDYFIGLGYTF